MWRYHLLEHGYEYLLLALVLFFILFGHWLPRIMRTLFRPWFHP
jgi:hypothetical protein